jgi:hypothetical protein
MKNPIAWKPSFNGILLIDSQLVPTIFDIALKMEVVSDDHVEQELALQRIQTIVESIFGASIICEMSESAADMPYTFNNNIVAIPGTPTDQLLCGLTFTKTNAVAEGRIKIISVSLNSSRGNGIEYYFDIATPVPLFLQKTSEEVVPWWLRNDVSTTDSFQIDKNLIHFPFEYPTWDELEMSWEPLTKESSDSEDNGTIINFNSITKNED